MVELFESSENTSQTLNVSEKFEHRNPFECMKIDDNAFLNAIDGRSPCTKCSKSRKFFCYTCYVPVKELENRLPKVQLPIQIDIIKHQREIDGKSTAIHAAILARDNVNIYTFPDIPDYSSAANQETVSYTFEILQKIISILRNFFTKPKCNCVKQVLIFPTHNSIHVDGIFDGHVRLENVEDLKLPRGVNRSTLLKHRLNEVTTDEQEEAANSTKSPHLAYTLHNLPIKRAVFIDSTWNQCKSIFNDARINCLRTVVLQNRLSQFWRHQKGSPRWFLATIEGKLTI